MKLNFTALMVAAHIGLSAAPIFAQENKNCETLANADSSNAKRINQLLKDKQFVVLDDVLNDKNAVIAKVSTAISNCSWI